MSSFDYVIVGGGTAGLALAARLSEDPAVTVGILEAGKHVTTEMTTLIPGMLGQNVMNPETSWGLTSTPTTTVNDNRSFAILRGKAMGGSSAVNFMISGRASAPEYDAYESVLNAKGWNWPEFLKYIKKAETFEYDPENAKKFRLEVDPSVHGTSGPIKNGIDNVEPLHLKFFDALTELGVPVVADSSNGNSAGAGLGVGSIDRSSATRSFSATAYYEPVKDRSNLTAITGAYVAKVLFEKGASGKLKAVGVEYTQDGEKKTVTANKEVILSAGSYHTPQLLELSGIGDEQIMKSIGVPVLHHLPGVGKNLQDHWVTYVSFEADDSLDSLEVMLNPERVATEIGLYQTEKKGILAKMLTLGFAWLPTKYFSDVSSTSAKAKEVDITRTPSEKKTVELQKQWLADERIPALEVIHVSGFWPLQKRQPDPAKRYMSLALAIGHPLSRGSVHATSPDPSVQPAIDLRALEHPSDLDLLVDAIKYARKVFQTGPLKDLVKAEAAPGPGFESDEQIQEWVKDSLWNVFHPVGTASMLPLEDGGVVDPELKVYGTENLRVVDASILPVQIAAHIQMTVYAIAEKAADIIKNSA